MIKKLKKKFIILATVSMFILMTTLVGIMNAVNYTAVIAETDRTLNVLSGINDQYKEIQKIPYRSLFKNSFFIPHGMSPEVPYEARYFSALVLNNENIVEIDVSRIISVDKEMVVSYVQNAIESNKERGFIDQFRYVKQADDTATRIIFLDCGRKLDSFYTFLWTSIAVGLLGCLVVFILFLFAADRIIRPIAESYEKQKRFITDAGHEIKTPLTIISANLDLLESDYGDDEGLTDIRTQIKRLTELTDDLVYLSKMEESENTLTKVEFPVSDLVMETGGQFRALAQAGKKDYQVNIEPGLTMYGSPDAIRELISILLDNAMKYSPENGSLKLEMSAHKKTLNISVFNTTINPVLKGNLDHMFDRFYRADNSRNSETGGHGIGLSIAQAIVFAHKGKIFADTTSGLDLTITITIPLK